MPDTREVEAETIPAETLRAVTRNMVAPHSRGRGFFLKGDAVRVLHDGSWEPGVVVEPLKDRFPDKVLIYLRDYNEYGVVRDVCSSEICYDFDGFDPTALPVAYTVAEFALSS